MKHPRTVVYVVVWTALLLTLVLGASGGGGDGHARTMSGLFALRVQQVEVERLLRDRDRGLATDPPRVASALAEVGSAIEALPVEVDVEMDAAAAAALAAYREAFAPFLAGGPHQLFELGELRLTIGSNVAFAHALLRIEAEQDFAVRLTLGFVKIHGRWSISHEHHSATV